mmetsp:Transcript_117354/g.230252  ORF Transcript_117354/g.230252 Transcript_117354/m.230252 type:complete len:94 (-) Transcript_117354:230-511(-)
MTWRTCLRHYSPTGIHRCKKGRPGHLKEHLLLVYSLTRHMTGGQGNYSFKLFSLSSVKAAIDSNHQNSLVKSELIFSDEKHAIVAVHCGQVTP